MPVFFRSMRGTAVISLTRSQKKSLCRFSMLVYYTVYIVQPGSQPRHITPMCIQWRNYFFVSLQRIMDHFDMNGDAEIEKEEFKHVGLILLSNQKFRFIQSDKTERFVQWYGDTFCPQPGISTSCEHWVQIVQSRNHDGQTMIVSARLHVWPLWWWWWC